MKTITVCSLSALMLLPLVAGCGKKHASENEDVQEVSVALPTVDSVVLRQEYPATLIAASMTDIVARVNGTIQKQLYTDGQTVAAGQPLFLIESTTYRDQVNQAQGALETALAENEYASKQYAAMKKALEADAVSKMDVIQAESNLRSSEAAIKTARAQLETARTNLGYCTVRAPFAGKVASSPYVVGSYIGGEGAPVTLTKIYDDRTIFADFSVTTGRYMEIMRARKEGKLDFDHVPVTFGDSISGAYEGRLTYEAPDVSTSTGTVMLRLTIDNTGGQLREGMYATVSLPYASRPKALLIKDAAISTDQLGKYVYLVNDSDKVVYTPIQIGDIYHDTLRIVDSGLTPSDRYVTTALLKVRDGMTVKPLLSR